MGNGDTISIKKIVTIEGWKALDPRTIKIQGAAWMAAIREGKVTVFHQSDGLQVLNPSDTLLLSFTREQRSKDWRLAAVITKGTKSGNDKPVEALADKIAADSLLHLLVGKWEGKGVSFGKAVEDLASFDTTIGSRFIFMKLTAVKGDNFRAEGYVWFNPVSGKVEFYEFNSGVWPVRILSGYIQGEQIILEEKTADRFIRIVFSVRKDNFYLEEAKMSGNKKEIFVSENFRRTQ
ncbi:MAG: hypothetical protein K0Q66_1008 [Chitinophagaceae bacterium]|jgi:hypothetical protein|nr:hypothetical protein [Chitinophagaceae bacterium]